MQAQMAMIQTSPSSVRALQFAYKLAGLVNAGLTKILGKVAKPQKVKVNQFADKLKTAAGCVTCAPVPEVDTQGAEFSTTADMVVAIGSPDHALTQTEDAVVEHE